MPVIYQKRIYREDLKQNRNVLYLFGDNEARVGYGGQAAEMRGEPNAIGIRTKQDPGTFWSDLCLDHNKQCLDEDFNPLIQLLENQRLIIIPSDGVGTGLSKMPTRCPKTFKYLQDWLITLGNFPPIV